MTNEDAIKWLENLRQDIGQLRHEDLWPYAQAIDEISELLEEQEAKLLTFEEVKNHFHVPIKLLGDIEKYVDFENDIEPLYLECDIEDAWTVQWRTYDNTKEYLESWEKDYGKTWRCWTKKPTEEQKRSVKWE